MPFCPPSKINIPEDRFRNITINCPETVEMAGSIKEVGQLLPILVTKDMTLVDGACRVRACERLGRDVWWVDEVEGKLILDTLLSRRKAELQANLKRKDFTPSQLAVGIAELDRLMKETYGEGRPGQGDPEKWTQEKTAKMLGLKSHTSVSDALIIDNALRLGIVPGLVEAKSMQEAKKMVKDVVRLEAAKELARRRAAVSETEVKDPVEFFGKKIILGDCLTKMKALPANICSLYVTDPPWKIGMDKVSEDRGSAAQKALGSYDDSSDEIIPLLKDVIKEMYRIAKPDCYAVMFCGVRNWLEIAEAFRKTGFAVYSKMLVWVKIRSYDSLEVNISKSHAPAIWPNSAYDTMILARKGQPVIYQMGKPDVFLHPPVPSSQRIHQAQKPISLMVDIISRFYHPGTNPLLIDPFAGVGSTLVAAERVGIKNYLGFELDPEFRERAIAFMVSSYLDDQRSKEVLSEINLEDFE